MKHLTDRQVKQIKRMYAEQGGRHGTVAMLARKFDVSRPAIYRALDSFQTVTFDDPGPVIPGHVGASPLPGKTEAKRYTPEGTPIAKEQCPDLGCAKDWCGMICVTCETTLWTEYGPQLLYVDWTIPTFKCEVCDQSYKLRSSE